MDYAYEMREAQEFQSTLREVDRAPLAERKEACAEFLEAMRHSPDLVAERIGWLLDGNYGYGSMQAAKRVIKGSSRMNKAAQLTHMVAALEWRCPARMAAQAWKALSSSEKKALDRAVGAEIKAAERSE